MNVAICARAIRVATVLAIAPVVPAAAQSANAQLKDTNRQDAGAVSLLQTPAGALLKLSLKGMPPGEHAFHIHAAGRCDPPSFETVGPHFTPGSTRRCIIAGA